MERNKYSALSGIYTSKEFQFIVKPAMILTFSGSYPQLGVFGIVLAIILCETEIQYFFKNYMIKTFAGLGFY